MKSSWPSQFIIYVFGPNYSKFVTKHLYTIGNPDLLRGFLNQSYMFSRLFTRGPTTSILNPFMRRQPTSYKQKKAPKHGKNSKCHTKIHGGVKGSQKRPQVKQKGFNTIPTIWQTPEGSWKIGDVS